MEFLCWPIYLDERATDKEKRANAAAMRKAFDGRCA